MPSILKYCKVFEQQTSSAAPTAHSTKKTVQTGDGGQKSPPKDGRAAATSPTANSTKTQDIKVHESSGASILQTPRSNASHAGPPTTPGHVRVSSATPAGFCCSWRSPGAAAAFSRHQRLSAPQRLFLQGRMAPGLGCVSGAGVKAGACTPARLPASPRGSASASVAAALPIGQRP